MKKKYGYARVSSKEQNLDRQIKALLDAGVDERDIVTDKANTKAYGAAYKGEQLTDIIIKNIIDYEVINLNTIDLDITNADTISLLVWDENLSPLCEKISFNIGGGF